jgi:hypothetical protein
MLQKYTQMFGKSFFTIGLFCLTSYAWAQLPSQRSYMDDTEKKDEKKVFDRPAGASVYFGLAGSGISGATVVGQAQGNFGRFNKIGLLGGLAYTSPINNTLDFQVEVMMIRKGAAEPAPDDPAASGTSNRTRIGVNFLEIPVGIRYHMYLGDAATALANHISADLLLTGGAKLWEGYSDRQTDGYVSTDGFNNFMLGYILGVNYHLNKSITLTFRWNNSLTPLNNVTANTGTETLFNQVFGSGPRSQTLNIQFWYNF